MTLWLAHPGSRLAALADRHDAGAPYWGFPWPGGLALATHVLAHQASVRGRRVLDFGSGCGIAGIAAHLAGAASVTLADADPLARAASALNASENGLVPADLLSESLGRGDIVLAADVFYDPDAARESLARLTALKAQGTEILVGDPFRPDLPRAKLREIARTSVREVGASPTTPAIDAGIFVLADGNKA